MIYRISCVLFLIIVAVPNVPLSKTHVEFSYDKENVQRLEQCPTAEQIKLKVAARLGRNPFREEAERQLVVELKTASAERLIAEVQLRKADGSLSGGRTLEATDGNCRQLFEAVVLAISIAIEPAFLEPSPENDVESSSRSRDLSGVRYRVHYSIASAAHRTALTRQETTEKKTRERSASRSQTAPTIEIIGHGGPGVSIGTAPTPSFSPVAGISLELGQFALRLDGRLEVPTTQETAEGDFETSLIVGEAAVCGIFDPLFACGLFAGGRLRQRRLSQQSSLTTSNAYTAAGARLGGQIELTHRLGVRLRGELLGLLTPTEILFEGNQVWRTPDISAYLGAFIYFRFL